MKSSRTVRHQAHESWIIAIIPLCPALRVLTLYARDYQADFRGLVSLDASQRVLEELRLNCVTLGMENEVMHYKANMDEWFEFNHFWIDSTASIIATAGPQRVVIQYYQTSKPAGYDKDSFLQELRRRLNVTDRQCEVDIVWMKHGES